MINYKESRFCRFPNPDTRRHPLVRFDPTHSNEMPCLENVNSDPSRGVSHKKVLTGEFPLVCQRGCANQRSEGLCIFSVPADKIERIKPAKQKSVR